MKKSLIALAVAGVFAAPVYAASGNVDVYGQMMFSVDHIDAETVAAGDDESDLVTGRDNVSRIGFKGSEDLGGGMKALWQFETALALPATGAGTASATNARNTFVGLNGDFGTVLLGRHDTPYKMATGKLDPFADTAADYNAIIGRSSATAAAGLFDLRADNLIAYTSPNFGGFYGSAAYFETKVAEAAGVDNSNAWSLMGAYENGPFFVSLAYETHEGALTAAGLGASSGVGVNDDINAWKLGGGYTFGDAKLGLVYEDISDGDTNAGAVGGRANERTAWYLSGSYALGPVVLKAAYGTADDSETVAVNNDGADFLAIGVDYNMSKRTSVFALYTTVDNEGVLGGAPGAAGSYAPIHQALGGAGGSVDTFSVGIKHGF